MINIGTATVLFSMAALSLLSGANCGSAESDDDSMAAFANLRRWPAVRLAAGERPMLVLVDDWEPRDLDRTDEPDGFLGHPLAKRTIRAQWSPQRLTPSKWFNGFGMPMGGYVSRRRVRSLSDREAKRYTKNRWWWQAVPPFSRDPIRLG